MSDDLQPGDRVLDLREATCLGGMFAGLLAAPLASALSRWRWGWCAAAAAVSALTGLAVAGMVERLLWPAPPGQAVVVRCGPAALGSALRASVAGGTPISLACAVAALADGSASAAMFTLLAGVGASVASGRLGALA